MAGVGTSGPDQWTDIPAAHLKSAAGQLGVVGGLFRRYGDCALVEELGAPVAERLREPVRGRVPPLTRVGVALDLHAVERCQPEMDAPSEALREALLSQPALAPSQRWRDAGAMQELWSTARVACLLGRSDDPARQAAARRGHAYLDRLAEGAFATSFSVIDAFAATNLVAMEQGCGQGLDWWEDLPSG
jgi:hypothetical protein